MYNYFFSGNQYIRVTRDDTGPGAVDAGYPRTISPNWGWGSFGANGIDAALYSGSKCYFFAGGEYIQTTRGVTGPGTIDPGYPRPIADWGWGAFGAHGIDAALYSNSKCYFFSGKEYIRVTRGETGPGTVDAGYPRPISVWGWGSFGANGIDAALYSGSRCYFFSGGQYIRVTRADEGAGTVDAGYPKPISPNWGWGNFGKNGISGALNSGGPYAVIPEKGLGSNSNYFLYSPAPLVVSAGAHAALERRPGGGLPIFTSCNHLLGLSVHIMVDTDITGTNGFGFQINAYSSSGAYDGAQQYVVLLIPNATQPSLTAVVNNWHNKQQWVIFIEDWLANLPTNTLPAGYQIIMTLLNDAAHNINGATFVVIDNHGNTVGNRTISLSNQPAQNLAPIVAFQLNFVGDIGGATTMLASGAGTMTYTASNLMSVLNTEPSCVDWNYSTVEAANSMYSLLPGTLPSHSFTQSFGLSVGGKVIHRVGKVQRMLAPVKKEP